MKKTSVCRWPFLLKSRSTSFTLGEFLLVYIFLTSPSQGAGVTLFPSPTIPSAPLSSASAASSRNPVLPTISPLPPGHSCNTGPDFVGGSDRLTITDRIYLDLSEPVNCTGVITSWYYCHIVIGFRDKLSGLWPCAWRRSNDSSGYVNVGCNEFAIIPGAGEDLRCGEYAPTNPTKMIRVEEGDYIGFYIPDSGLFMALSDSVYDEGHYQLERNETGFSNFIGDWELRNASSTAGRALLRAEIDSNWVHPSVTVVPNIPSPMPTPTLPPETVVPPTTNSPATPVFPLAVSLVIAIGVTVVLIITVIALIAYVNCKQRCFSEYDRFRSGMNEMDYNGVYKFRNANHVVVGNQRTFVGLRENPAYDSMSPTQNHEGRYHEAMAEATRGSAATRRQLEHTYESLSNFHIHATNVNNK